MAAIRYIAAPVVTKGLIGFDDSGAAWHGSSPGKRYQPPRATGAVGAVIVTCVPAI